MMRHSRFSSQCLLEPLVILLAVTGVLLGCSSTQPVSPAPPTDDTSPAIIDATDAQRPAQTSGPSDCNINKDLDLDSASIKEFLGTRTAFVKPGEDARIQLDYLKGYNEFGLMGDAIVSTTEIVVSTWRVPSSETAIYEFHFGPDGTRFNTSAWLVLEQALFTRPHLPPPISITWWYLDPSTDTWSDPLIITLAGDGHFHIPVDHFSTYQAVGNEDFGLSQGGQ
jgi:hypothetical protein